MGMYHQRDEIKIHMITVEIDISSSHGPAVIRFTFWLETEKEAMKYMKHWYFRCQSSDNIGNQALRKGNLIY